MAAGATASIVVKVISASYRISELTSAFVLFGHVHAEPFSSRRADAIRCATHRIAAVADEQQVALLKQGADAWNAWRERNLSTKVGLTGAKLSGANLAGANLYRADLAGAVLTSAHLRDADLTSARPAGADLTGAYFAGATLADLDLSQTLGLEAIIHLGPSTIDQRTLERSGSLPLGFLRGCG